PDRDLDALHPARVRPEPQRGAGPARIRRGADARGVLDRAPHRHRVLQAEGDQGGGQVSTTTTSAPIDAAGPPGASAGIVVDGLTKRFGSFTAVDDVGFRAVDGRIAALLGPSGSGKSTVLRMIAGLERPSAGRITIAGEDQTEASVQDR